MDIMEESQMECPEAAAAAAAAAAFQAFRLRKKSQVFGSIIPQLNSDPFRRFPRNY